jgi:hypothetical protein
VHDLDRETTITHSLTSEGLYDNSYNIHTFLVIAIIAVFLRIIRERKAFEAKG